MRIKVEVVTTHQCNKRQVRFISRPNGQSGWRRDRSQNRRAEHNGFLHHFHRNATGNYNDTVFWRAPDKQNSPHKFVQCVVAPDILANGDKPIARNIKPAA